MNENSRTLDGMSVLSSCNRCRCIVKNRLPYMPTNLKPIGRYGLQSKPYVLASPRAILHEHVCKRNIMIPVGFRGRSHVGENRINA